jgi:hypothetical protein
MAVQRNTTSTPLPYFGPLSGISAYASRGGEIMHYVSSGTNPNDVIGATYRVHIFDKVGQQHITFDRPGSVDVLLVAGGGSGGTAYERYQHGGGGGAGGLLQLYGQAVDVGYTEITVGFGGAGFITHSGENVPMYSGGVSSFGAAIAQGGGKGGSRGDVYSLASSGGSGGGASDTAGKQGGLGSIGQGNDGGSIIGSDVSCAAGGGGAGEPGSSAGSSISATANGDGGDGLPVAFYSNEEVWYAGGGAGARRNTIGFDPVGGRGGGANGIVSTGAVSGLSANFYGGGGSGGVSGSGTAWNTGGSGYQGLVMVRYRIG